MNSDYPKSLSVDSVIVHPGWFGTVAYAVDLIAAIVLLYLLIRNAMALCQPGASAITQVQIRFRLLLPFTFGVLAFGMVHYAILDAALRHKAIKDGVKDQPQPPPGN